jgi:hypothetical protein
LKEGKLEERKGEKKRKKENNDIKGRRYINFFNLSIKNI